MFSSDIAKVRLAELKAKGDGGTIQRLRKSCEDAAAVMEHTSAIVLPLPGKRLTRKVRVALSNELERGARLLRRMSRLSPPKGAK